MSKETFPLMDESGTPYASTVPAHELPRDPGEEFFDAIAHWPERTSIEEDRPVTSYVTYEFGPRTRLRIEHGLMGLHIYATHGVGGRETEGPYLAEILAELKRLVPIFQARVEGRP